MEIEIKQPRTRRKRIPIIPYDHFIVGHAAPEENRGEMVDWLKTNYPKVKILVLNPPHQPLPNADYNAIYDDPEVWLVIVTGTAC